MAFRDDLLKRIEKKKAEIAELQTSLREATSYLQALEDTLKLIPRDEAAANTQVRENVDLLRPNSAVAKARDLIRAKGRPLHIEGLLKGLGRPVTKATRAALSGSIAAYVRKGEIFTKTAPNTFGLKEFKTATAKTIPEDDLPEDFGLEDIDEKASESGYEEIAE